MGNHMDIWNVPLPRQSLTPSVRFPPHQIIKHDTLLALFKSLRAYPHPPPQPHSLTNAPHLGLLLGQAGGEAGLGHEKDFPCSGWLQGGWKGPTWLLGFLKIERCLNSSIGLA